MRLALFATLAACGPVVPPDRPALLRDASGNAAKLGKLMRGSVANAGLWFDSPACLPFAASRDIPQAELAAFARCLATLALQPSPRKDSLPDVVVLTYAPGFEIEARIILDQDGPRLTYIGFVGKRDNTDTTPTILPAVFETLRTAGTLAPHAAKEFTWVKLCIDETGAITGAHPHETTSLEDQDATIANVKTWQLRPFVVAGQPMPVCTVMRFGDGPAVETIPLPPPRAGDRERLVINVRTLEQRRIAGDRRIAPDDTTKLWMTQHGPRQLYGSFRFCIDERGRVESVFPIRSTGMAGYDREIVLALKRWAYRPFGTPERPVQVCSAIMITYSQR